MTQSKPRFTVCALLYGDYPNLAKRCLDPLLHLASIGDVELRVGMNEVSKVTSDFVRYNLWQPKIFEASPQIFKYPMMRKMFHDEPVVTDYIMWFDDDSYIKVKDCASWLEAVTTEMSDCDMLGSVYTILYGTDQKEWCKTQPWYKGKPISDKPRFATGGWWCIKTEVVNRLNWPITQLKHCGGDVALGVALNQNDLKLKHYNQGVAINANAEGKESAAERRGASRTEKPIGKGFTAGSL
jgi:hypothetical protein